MSILNQFGVALDKLALNDSKTVGFESPVIPKLGDTVRGLKNYDSITGRMERLADIPEKLTKDNVVKATNSANRALAHNVKKASYLKAVTSEFTAMANNLKMEMTAKQQMIGVMDGAQQAIDVYGRAVDNSKFGEDVLEAGYKAYQDELSGGGKVNLGDW